MGAGVRGLGDGRAFGVLVEGNRLDQARPDQIHVDIVIRYVYNVPTVYLSVCEVLYPSIQ